MSFMNQCFLGYINIVSDSAVSSVIVLKAMFIIVFFSDNIGLGEIMRRVMLNET